MTSLIAIAVNLAGMLLIYSWMAFALARWRRNSRGLIGVLATIIAAGVFWIVPAMFLFGRGETTATAYAIWFGNWLVSGFGVALFSQAAVRIPSGLQDSARLDGCGWFVTYRYVVFPFVSRELAIIIILTVMATSVHCLTPNGNFTAGMRPPPWFVLPGQLLAASRPIESVGLMSLGSLIMTLPLIAIFLLAKRRAPSG
ncbi:MAG: multiple sugar transport system permease protein [Verrucomicrobiota bacterium]